MPIDSRGSVGWRTLVGVMLFGIVMALVRPVPSLDFAALDLGFRLIDRLHPASPAAELVIVGIDEPTIHEWREPLSLMHRHLGALLQALAAGGARAAAVDVVLPQRSFDAVAPGYDFALIEGILAMRSIGPVVLARSVDDAGDDQVIHPPFLAAAGPAGSGFALLPVDSDGKVRRVDEALSATGEIVPTFVGQLARSLGVATRPGLIDFTHPIGISALSMGSVLAWARDDDRRALRAAFANKVVFVGALLPYIDRHRLPVAVTADYPASSTPGVFVHAQTFHGFAAGRRIIEREAASVLLAALGCALLWSRSTTWASALSLSAAAVVVAIGVGTAGLGLDAGIPVGNATLAMLLCSTARLLIDVGSELLARRRLRQAFAGYVSPAVMAELEAGRLDALSSRRQHLCVLFLDIRGFTKRTEAESPEVVLEMLRILFDTATKIVHRGGGTVKEFMGDGVMALFGAPVALDHPEQAAFDAARAMITELAAVNRSLMTSRHAPISIGIGLASGEVVVGNIGGSTRYAYGAVGDCVNVASRLEGLTKSLGYPVVMSERLASTLADRAGLADLGDQAISGHGAVRVFGWTGEDRIATT